MKNLLMVMVFVTILLLGVGMVSAWEFDNQKGIINVGKGEKLTIGDKQLDYNVLWETYKPVKVTNLFGLGETLFEGVITKHTSQCENDCSSEMQIYIANDGALIDDVKFMQKYPDGSWIEKSIRSYQFYLMTDESEIDVDDYETQCEVKKTLENGTQFKECKQVKSGTHKEKQGLWKPYALGEEVKAGTYYIKLEGERPSARWIDWQITSQGKLIEDWAIWGDYVTSFDTGIPAGAQSVGTNGSVIIVTDFLGKTAHEFDMSGNLIQNFSLTDMTSSAGIDWNGSNWFVIDDLDKGIYKYDGAFNLISHCHIASGTTWIDLEVNNTNMWAVDIGGGTPDIDELDMNCGILYSYPSNPRMGITMNESNLFVLNQVADNISMLDFVTNTISNFSLNTNNPTGYGLDLWNGYFYTADNAGKVFKYFSNSFFSTTLNSPADNYVSTSSSVEFNCSASASGGTTIANISLWTNMSGSWVLNETVSYGSSFGEYVSSFDTGTTGTNAQGIGTNGTVIVVSEYTDDLLYIYDMNGNFIQSVTAPSGDNTGITNNGSNWFILDAQNDNMYKLDNSFNTLSNCHIVEDKTWMDLTNNNSNMWMMSAEGDVDKFDMNCGLVANYEIGATIPRGITMNGSNLFFMNKTFIKTYTLNGVSTNNNFSIDIETSNPYALDLYGGYFYVSEGNNKKVFKYFGGVGSASQTAAFNKNIANDFDWTCRAFDSDGVSAWATENRSITFVTSSPIITITSPVGLYNYGYTGKNETLTWNISAVGLGSIWYNYNGVNKTVYGAANSTNLTLTSSPFNVTLYANNTYGQNSSYVNWSYRIFNNNETYNTTTYETASETFTINVTANSSLTAAHLIYGGTSYAGTQSGLVWSKTIDIATGSSNKVFYWNFTYAGSQISSTSHTQTVNYTYLVLCNATYPTAYVNFTFADESTSAALNVSVNLATWTYWLGSGATGYTKTYIYQNTSPDDAAFNYAFCFAPADKPLNADLSFKYSKASPAYPLRTFSYDNAVLTNTTTNKILYMLGTVDGIYSAFRTADTAGGAISGATITYERQIGGVWTLLGQEITGADGIATLWLNPNYQYRISASKTGYTSVQETITPSQSQYTITMSSGTGGTFSSSVVGLRWAVYPGSGTLNPGNHNFNATISSYYGDLENCKLELLDATNPGTVLTGITGITNSTYCSINFDYTISKNSKYFGRLSADTTNSTGFFIIDSDWYWLGMDINNSQSWSKITSFFQDIKGISELGEGTEGEFSRLVLFFLIFTMMVGVFTYFSGIEMSNPGVSIILIWGIILFASAGNFFTYTAGTNLTGASASFIAQYGLLLCYTILSAGYILGLLRKTGE